MIPVHGQSPSSRGETIGAISFTSVHWHLLIEVTMINPYTSYSIAFTISLLTYGLGWSKLYPPLSIALFALSNHTNPHANRGKRNVRKYKYRPTNHFFAFRVSYLEAKNSLN
ncbi:hypothetical protein BH09BAC3_BH09BAC3_20410 [soil metagenome]